MSQPHKEREWRSASDNSYTGSSLKHQGITVLRNPLTNLLVDVSCSLQPLPWPTPKSITLSVHSTPSNSATRHVRINCTTFQHRTDAWEPLGAPSREVWRVPLLQNEGNMCNAEWVSPSLAIDTKGGSLQFQTDLTVLPCCWTEKGISFSVITAAVMSWVLSRKLKKS
jgi:hypothetical protein